MNWREETGGEAEAKMILRYSSSDPGLPLDAIAPRSQITRRPVSKFVVPIYSRRPSAWAWATLQSNCGVMLSSILRFSGSEETNESDHKTAGLNRF